jgi:hypothetical protein
MGLRAAAAAEGDDVVQDLVGMRADVLHRVQPPNHAFRVDQDRHALGEVGPLLVRPLLGAVLLAGRPVDVGQQAIREALCLGERLVVLRRVEGDPDDGGIGIVELWGSITEPLSFDGSAGGGGLGVPPQHDPLTPQISQRNGVAVLVGQ